MKILHLTLKKKWFDLIASGEKKVEYREIKPYWIKRLLNEDDSAKEFDEIYFKNGYKKDSPFMRVKFEFLSRGRFEEKNCFAIKLGEVLELRNSAKPKNEERSKE